MSTSPADFPLLYRSIREFNLVRSNDEGGIVALVNDFRSRLANTIIRLAACRYPFPDSPVAHIKAGCRTSDGQVWLLDGHQFCFVSSPELVTVFGPTVRLEFYCGVWMPTSEAYHANVIRND